MSDLAQALSMFAAGVGLGALAWRLTRSENRELQRVIDGHHVRPVWQRHADPFAGQPAAHAPTRFGHLDEVIERSAQQTRRYQTTLPPVGSSAPRQLPSVADPRRGAPAGWEVSTSAPARDPNTNSDVIVPMMQSIITATVAALLLITLSLLALRIPWQTTLRAAGVCWSIVLALAWLWRLGIVTGLLAEIESMTGRDLDGDGAVGKTSHAVLLDPGKARAAIAEELNQQDTAGEFAALMAFVDTCYTLGCSETAHGVKPNTAAREAYLRHRDDLLALGIAAWRNENRPTAGWQMVVSRERARRLIAAHVGEI